MERSEQEKLRKANCKAEAIFRNESDRFCALAPPVHTPRSPYPWESESTVPRITKEFFRCKGSSLSPPIDAVSDAGAPLTLVDCEGYSRHGVHAYPLLIDLLNYLQKRTSHRVIITCGHRCPAHNTYADQTPANRASKHQIGAEVDFYVQGMEERPQEVAGLIMQYFQETAPYKNEKESRDFRRLESDLAIQPWANKEIILKLFQKNEGRDGDNRHPHPYLSIQLCYDRTSKKKIAYTWAEAHQKRS